MENRSPIEILAPCGSYEALTAAVRSGADAVYIGMQQFSARANADNFGGEELERALAYCRLHGVKAHVAVNTLVDDTEIEKALEAAQRAYLAGADAFIVQDWGLAQLIRKSCPGAELHASTQMTVHTPEAARFLYEQGFDRVVLAREMNKSEIEQIVKSCPVQTEVFVHGALCMCVSGQCYLSAMLGGRSGNRGRCAQPCRLPFSVKGGTGHDLSLKDNCLISYLSELVQIGVTSAKIEGRMKRPEYVAAAVSACRTAVDSGRADKEQIDRLRAVFSRGGFTDGYYTSNLGRNMFGTRSKDDVTAATDKLLSQIRTEYKDERQSRSADVRFILKEGERARVEISSGGHTVCVGSDEPQRALKAPLSAEKAESQLRKTGGTAFIIDKVTAEIDEGLTVPISQINSMRRDALSKLEEKLSEPPRRVLQKTDIPHEAPHRRRGEIMLRASFSDCDIPDVFKECELVFVPLFSRESDILNLKEKGFKVGVKLPRMIFGRENAVLERLERLKELSIIDVWCGNIGTAALGLKLGMRVHGGFSLNVFNTRSMDLLESSGLEDTEVSFELTAGKINSLGGGMKRGIVGYGHLPLMITRNCPNKNGAGCKSCGGQSAITDRKGTRFTLMCDGVCTELLNGDALVLSDKLDGFKGADFVTLAFTYETKDERKRVFKMYKNNEKPSGRFTRGLYFRGVE